MVVTLAPAIANRLYLAAAAASRAAFARALHDPTTAQATVLRRIVRANAGSAFGRAHRFASVHSLADFRARVPLRTYDDLVADIERIVLGEQGVLTTGPVRFLEPSGGSSGASKLVPYTRELLREFSAATLPWVFDLLWHRPALRGGTAYWAVTPPARANTHTAGGLPIGMEHDSDYFPAVARMLLDRVLGVPRALARAPDLATCRYLTLRALLARPDLALISVWNPSFLTGLAHGLDAHWSSLLRDLERGTLSLDLGPSLRAELMAATPARPARAALLRRRFGRRPPLDLGDLWTHLSIVSCWTDGHAARALIGMRARFPRVEVQPKGLLATEGVVSIPLFAAAHPVAAVTSHFLEFLPEAGDETDVRTVAELEAGRLYEPVLTTSGGLYRYRLRDLVRVEGDFERTPMIRFMGRADGASDIAGEKLTPAFVEQVLCATCAELGVRPPFVLLAPSLGRDGAGAPGYDLYVEAGSDVARRMAEGVEQRLLEGHHYALCRALGQLRAARGVVVVDGERTFERVCLGRGQRAGAIKPPALDRGTEWQRAFGVAVTEEEIWTTSS